MSSYDIENIVITICVTIYLISTTCLIHYDIETHEENETMLEKYRIEMQYKGEVKDE